MSSRADLRRPARGRRRSGPALPRVLALAAPGLLLACASASPEPSRATPETGPAYEWRLPAGLPIPLVPADNPMSEAKVALGRHLFYDTRLSVDRSFACASCHRHELAFTDGKPRAVGVTGEVHPRGSMSLANVAYNRAFNWGDPEKERLEDQMRVPMFGTDPIELGLGGLEDELIARLSADARYRRMFAEAFSSAPDPVTVDNVVAAIAAFERTLISGNSPYDRLVFWGDDSEFPAAARRGMRLFFSERTSCGRCHATFNFSGAIAFEGSAPAEPDFHNTGLYNVDGAGSYPERNRGVFEFTGEAADMGRFRPPTLRNIEVTAPYMHDGSLHTLGEVIDHYAAGGRQGRDHPYKSELVAGFELSAAEKADLIAFLKSLTDREFLADPRFSNPWLEIGAGASPSP